MERGRPTKYADDTIERANEYIDNHEKYGNGIPSRAGLAWYLGVSMPTLDNWADKYPDFLDTLEIMKVKQEMLLIDGGLFNRMNANIAKLMLANYGYSDKQRVEHEGELPEITIKIIDG